MLVSSLKEFSCLEELGKLDAINTKVSMHIGTAIHVKSINYFFFLNATHDMSLKNCNYVQIFKAQH